MSNLSDIGKRLFEEYDSQEDAVAAFVRLARKDTDIRNELMFYGAKAIIAEQRRTVRSFTFASAYTEVNSVSNERAGVISNVNRSAFMNMVFRVNGKEFKLGDADKSLLDAAASHYIEQGNTMIKRGNFLEKVSSRLTDENQVVKDVLSEDELKRLY